LSGGERQRVAIAKALYSNPSVILADEPTASLDSDRAYEVMELLKNETKNKNTTTIVVTHDTRLVVYCANFESGRKELRLLHNPLYRMQIFEHYLDSSG
jgi:ABC-type lipoprotein export system ATPase subunit